MRFSVVMTLACVVLCGCGCSQGGKNKPEGDVARDSLPQPAPVLRPEAAPKPAGQGGTAIDHSAIRSVTVREVLADSSLAGRTFRISTSIFGRSSQSTATVLLGVATCGIESFDSEMATESNDIAPLVPTVIRS